MGLIFTSLLILTIPGIIYNNETASGLNPSFALNCPGYPDLTCQNSNPSGCQVVPSQCSLSGSSISILNQNSPFTPLLSGQLPALNQFLNGQGPASSGAAPQGPFDIGGSATAGQYYVANCGKSNAGASVSVRLLLVDGCTQINAEGNQNLTLSTAFKMTNWNTGSNQSGITKTAPFYNLVYTNETATPRFKSTTAIDAGKTLCIANTCGGFGSIYTYANDLEVLQLTSIIAGAIADIPTVSDSFGNAYTVQDSFHQTCAGGGADTCWVGSYTAPNIHTGFFYINATFPSAPITASGWWVACSSCTTTGLVVEHLGNAAGHSASVGSFTPTSGTNLVMGTATIAGANTGSTDWTGSGAGFILTPPGSYGSFVSAGQGEIGFTGSATTVPISNAAGTGWAETVISIQYLSSGNDYNFNCALVGQGTSVTGYGSSNHTADLNGYTYYGCDLYKGSNPNTANDGWFSILMAVPNVTSQDLPAGYTHFTAFVQPVPWEAYFCGLAGYQPSLYQAYASPQCTNFFNSLNRWTVDAAGNTFDGGVLAPLITFVLGMALLLLGLGINFRVNGSFFGSGAGVGVGSNRQGTKLAQTLGIALLVWSPLYSEFSFWFGSSVLPNGLGGSLGVIGFSLTAMFFGGAFWQATQD